MLVCGEKCKRWTTFGTAIASIILGTVIVICWGLLFKSILSSELAVNNGDSRGYTFWKETPIPMYIEFYLFNWTNADEVEKDWSIKPVFEQCGPFTFSEHHVRVNISWRDNGTLSYQQKRIWKYLPDRTNGSLDDEIINLNVITATVAYFVRHENIFIKRAVSVFLDEKEGTLTAKHTVRELLFDGYEDELLNLVKKLNITSLNIPMDKFGWFVGRNESSTYDGNFTMFDGSRDINQLGVIESWNGAPQTDFYSGYCSYVNGTSGELWPPDEYNETVSIFAPDICSSLSLSLSQDTPYLYGLEGKKFVANDVPFDNGTKYPTSACFNTGEIVPSGTRNVSKCKFGAPAFVSFPHFYLADSSYRDSITGMKPNKSEHEFSISLEPVTGVPLDVRAQMQINILIQPIEGIWLFEKVKKTFVPMLWFRQTAELTHDFSDLIKILVTLPAVGKYTGYGILSIGILILFVWIFVSIHKGWKGQDGQQLLPQQVL